MTNENETSAAEAKLEIIFMPLEERIDRMQKRYFSLYPRREYALNQMYLVPGSGYGWCEGQIICPISDHEEAPERIPTVEEAVDEAIKEFFQVQYQYIRMMAVQRGISANQFKKQIREANVKRMTSMVQNPPQHYYPLDEIEKMDIPLYCVPDNVTDDYLAGVYEIIRLVNEAPVKPIVHGLDPYEGSMMNQKNRRLVNAIKDDLDARFPNRKPEEEKEDA